MALGAEQGGDLVDFNVGLSAALGIIFPLGISLEGLAAQIDALLSIGLGPFMADLSLQFNASLAATATLTLQIGDPTLALQLAISALAQLQAALAAALQFPPITLSISAELSASIALGAALAARLGLIKVAIEIALKIKLGALKFLLGALDLAANLQAQLQLGPVWAFSMGSGSGNTDDLATIGSDIQTLFAAGLGTGGDKIESTDKDVYGIAMVTTDSSVASAMKAILGAALPDPP